jgi:hypothetical protein
MKNLLLAVLFVGLVSSMGVATDEMKFGEELTLEESTKISTILAEPDAFVGKKVRVEGKVVDVCAKMGCWMDLVGEDPTHKIKAKVKDGVIVFPMEAKGKPAIVEGEIEKLDLDLEQTVAYLKHMAEEQGESFDASSVTEPQTIYRIKAYGAVVK